MTADKKEFAFPTAIYNSAVDTLSGGLTKREWFAAMAMQGILSANVVFSALSEEEKKMEVREILARRSFEFADAMLKQSSEQSPAKESE